MSQDQTKKEALFNEVKGSLFEYLVARHLAQAGKDELGFQKSLDPNYLNVLSQQDRMVRQFYPEMFPFLNQVSKFTFEAITKYFGSAPLSPQLLGKFTNSSLGSEIFEADLLVDVKEKKIPLSLKLNKKNAYVNTKSGGIKSFFSHYFSYLDPEIQVRFNQLVDLEFNRMTLELHALHDLEFPGDYSLWVRKGFSELPGELDPDGRAILKRYYARLARELHRILSDGDESAFKASLGPLMGFGSSEIIQVTCFHDFKAQTDPEVQIHSYHDVFGEGVEAKLLPFDNISSAEIVLGSWSLQLRIKPMNKFTTTAIKINCSVKFRPPSGA